VEVFPVGEKLAFDVWHGRLWVVCPTCNRWNLSPLEERWDAVASCQRLWESSNIRASSDHIGIARRKSGLWLIRVGQSSSRNELAVWRWGRRTRTRRSRGAMVGTAAAVGAAAGVALVTPIVIPVALFLTAQTALIYWSGEAGLLEVERLDNAGDLTRLRKRHFINAGMNPSDDELGWSIHLERALTRKVQHPTFGEIDSQPEVLWTEFKGSDALEIARKAFPMLNRRHSKESTIAEGLDLIAARGGPENYLRSAAAEKPRWVCFKHYPEPMRLAIEMVLFEEEERRALEGELERLEDAWQQAEKIAAISDRLLPPKGWSAFKKKHGPKT
jgi:hypothetical protein